MSGSARRLTAVAPTPTTGPEDEVHVTLWDHITELRKRLIYSAYAVMAGFFLCIWQVKPISDWLFRPLLLALGQVQKCDIPLRCSELGTLYFHTATAPMFVNLRVAGYAAVFVCSPAILYQLYAFVAPGLYRRERRMIVPFVVLGTMSFVLGGLFARYLIMPVAFDVLIGQYASDVLTPQLDIDQAVDLLLMMLIAFGIIFELPLVLTLLARMGVVTSAFLSKWRRHAIVVNTIIAAIITPTGDPVNLALMAVPLCVFYELGIVGARFAEVARRKAEELPPENDPPRGLLRT